MSHPSIKKVKWVPYNAEDELKRAMKQIDDLEFRLGVEASEARKKIENLEHNLKVERSQRDRFYREVIEQDVIIRSLERRLREKP